MLIHSVVRRNSFGATHIGRGGTGNVFTAEDAQAAREAQQKAGHGAASDKEDENHLHLHNLLHPSRTHSGHGNHKENNKENKDKSATPERPGGHKKGERSESDMGWAEKGKHFLFGKKENNNEKKEDKGGKRDRSEERKSGNSSS